MTRWTLPRHWPVQDRAQYKPLDWFIPYDKNARTHPPAQVSLLAELLKTHGPDQPIVVDEDRVILKGHGRRLAAAEGAMTHFTFVQRLGLSDTEKEAMRFQDNQVALLSGWDKTLMTEGLSSLKAAGYDMLKLGFPESQLRMWGVTMGTEAAVDPEQAPEPVRDPVVRLGDLWVLGDHRIICGDSTDTETVKRVLGGKKPNLMVTDPPYGVNYDPSWRARSGVNLNAKKLGKVQNDDTVDWQPAWDLFKGDIVYVWHASWHTGSVQASLHNSGFNTACQIIWNKDRFALSRGDYHWKHEPCWYMIRKGKTHGWTGNRSQSSVWDIPARDDDGHGHGTQKPVECMKRPIENNSSVGDYIYEPFSGSGTTIIAAQLTGRRCLAIELDPVYVQMAVERWMKLTNQVATLDGKPFDQVVTERKKNASRNSRKSVQRSDSGNGGVQRPLRQGRNAGQPTARRVPPRQPPPVAGDT